MKGRLPAAVQNARVKFLMKVSPTRIPRYSLLSALTTNSSMKISLSDRDPRSQLMGEDMNGIHSSFLSNCGKRPNRSRESLLRLCE